jgi:uncharacterized protein YneF (UPF0154 family)
MEFFFIILVGIIIGWYLHSWIMVQRMMENPDNFIELANKIKKMDTKIKEQIEKIKSNEIRTEFLHGQCYVYDGETFLAQGEDLHEALSNAEKRFPGQYNFTLRLTEPNKSNQSS